MNTPKASKNATIFLASKLFTKSISFLLIPVWTSVFAPAAYGTIGNLLAWGGFLSPFVMIGLPNAVVRMKADCTRPGEWECFVQSIALVLLLSSAIFLIAGFIFGPTTWMAVTSGEVDFWPFVAIILASVSAGVLARLALAVNQAEQNGSIVFVIEQALSIGVIASALIFVFVLNLGVIGYLLGCLVGPGMVSVIYGSKLLRLKTEFRFEAGLVKSALAYGLPLLPQAVALWTLSLSDRVMIERFCGLTEAGLYNLAANFGIIISMVAVSINQAILPQYLQLAKVARVRKTVRRLSIGGLVGLACATILFLAGGSFGLSLMIDNRYMDSLSLVNPILLGCFFFGLAQFFMRPLVLARRTKLIAVLMISGAILNVVANLIFIPRYGVVGAAWTTFGSYFLTGVFAMMASRSSDAMELRFLDIGLVVFLVGLVFGVSAIWSENHLLALLIRIGVGLVVIGLILKIFWTSFEKDDSGVTFE